MPTLRAKFVCRAVDRSETCENIYLVAVYSDDKASTNYAWSQATPYGELRMAITNPAAFGKYTVGQEYFLDMMPAVT